jgi:hypothetical protein
MSPAPNRRPGIIAAVAAASLFAAPGLAFAQPASPPSVTVAPPGPTPPTTPTPPEVVAPPGQSASPGAGGPGRGVIRPPAGIDPAIRAPQPAPSLDKMPVIPPAATPGAQSK